MSARGLSGGGFWQAVSGANARAKFIAGIALLVIWHFGVSAFAPPFVAKPLNVAMVLPAVIADPEFRTATLATLSAVLQGLVIALIAGTFVGVAMGRVKIVDRLLNVYINGFYTLQSGWWTHRPNGRRPGRSGVGRTACD